MTVLSKGCIAFLNALHEKFDLDRRDLLEKREVQDTSKKLRFDPSSADIRSRQWKCIETPWLNRTVEITGPPTPSKMVINAITSGANCYMADFEDSLSPTWSNILDGQENLKAYLSNTLDYKDKLANCNHPAVLMVRPRGLHLNEAHMFNMSASLFDFGVFFYNNAYSLMARKETPYFYLAKLEHWEEAAWWQEVFEFAEAYLDLPQKTIKCTVLIETLPAVFQMDEILYWLRNSCVGLNCGRWDYIFSYIKTLQGPSLPDRKKVDMQQEFMEAYSRLLVNTCHRRGVAAMGGMSAFIPTKDEETNAIAIKQVKFDKLLEVSRGHDGTWVAHPGLVDVAREAFEMTLNEALEIAEVSLREEMNYDTETLLKHPGSGSPTQEGIQENCVVALNYLYAWLQGNGCVPINDLMEDAATAEISRTQLWHWIQEETFTRGMVEKHFNKAAGDLVGHASHPVFAEQAKEILFDLIFVKKYLEPWLTTVAYEQLLENEKRGLVK